MPSPYAPILAARVRDPFPYVRGFGNMVYSEALPGALPRGNRAPQRPPYGLVHEVLSGSAFNVPQAVNLRTERYRIRPTAVNVADRFMRVRDARFVGLVSAPFESSDTLHPLNPTYLMENLCGRQSTFLSGLVTYLGQGDVASMVGGALHLYAFAADMEREYFRNSDGTMMIIPWSEPIIVKTELGCMLLNIGELGVVQRGIALSVARCAGANPQGSAKGYVWEIYGDPPLLPEKGLIGTHGLANEGDFLHTQAWYEDVPTTQAQPLRLYHKFGGQILEAPLHRSPFDVVAFGGNYVPYKYDMLSFEDMNATRVGHPDPSIKTALTCASGDFVIFLGGLWLAAGNTFRPPYYHANLMSEAMGTVLGQYEGKEVGCGGLTVHNRMTGHGPSQALRELALAADTSTPVQTPPSLAFMVETRLPWLMTIFADTRNDTNYIASSWGGFRETFDPQAR